MTMWFQLPEGTTQISVGGNVYTGDENGRFEAPDELEADLTAAGITRTAPPGSEDPELEPEVDSPDSASKE